MPLVRGVTPCVCTVLAPKEDSVDDQERANHVTKGKQQASHEVGLVQLR
jgi:hypothetical protein